MEDQVKLQYHEQECMYKKKKELTKAANVEANFKKTLIIFFSILFVLTIVFMLWSWRHMEVFSSDDTKLPFNPPSIGDLAKTARYIAHYMDWCVISTISVAYNGIPFGVPVSVADGPVSNSSGVPYIYITPFSWVAKDLAKNASSSFSFSEAQSDYCSRNDYDPEDPRCARVTLTGKVIKLTNAEIPFARDALFSRHPVMKTWPSTHGFFFAKLQISYVQVLDYFGHSHEVSLKEYFAAKV